MITPSFVTEGGRPRYRIEEDGSITPMSAAIPLTPEIEAYNHQARVSEASRLDSQRETT